MLTAQPQLNLLAQHAAEGQDLSAAEIEQAIHDLLEPGVSMDAKAEFLLCLARKGETAREIADFAILLRDLAVDPHIDLGILGGSLLDTCGTGGDLSQTFNVSTASAFVLSAAGIPVAKHGNRSVTSKCGSADVLEALGCRIDLLPSRMKEGVETLKLGFLFAPLYHKTFKTIHPVRELLAKQGKRSIFNLLGPLINPARPNIQIVGVYDPEVTEIYAQVLHLMKLKRATVLHGYDPGRKPCLDEISPFGPTRVTQLHSNGNMETFDIDPAIFNLQKTGIEELRGGDPMGNARIILDIFSGKEKGPRRDFLLLNASVGFVLANKAGDMEEGIKKASELIDSGAVMEKLNAYRNFTQQA
ncbi:MAG: anthranilate phosphoribosyltransferase [Verrucomicrobiae bacterium]|nr:anthranilate phosphoribosyltransferase [Verrucomicrobiae bacterium]